MNIINPSANDDIRSCISKYNEIKQDYKSISLNNAKDIYDLHKNISDQINTVSQFKEKINKYIFNPKISKIAKEIHRIQKGLLAVEKELENKMKIETRNKDRFLSEKSQETIQGLDKSLEMMNSLHLMRPETLKKIQAYTDRYLSLEKNIDLYRERCFTIDEIKEVNEIIDDLKQCMKRMTLNQQRQTHQILSLLEVFKEDFINALVERNQLIENILKSNSLSLFSHSADLLIMKLWNQNEKIHKNLSEQELNVLKQIIECFWTFYPPYGMRIDLEDYLKINQEDLKALGVDIIMPSLSKFDESISNELKNSMFSFMNLECFMRLTPLEREILHAQRLNQLKNQITESRKMLRNPTKVIIIGAGPGGLTRALTATVQGLDWEVIEKRERIHSDWVEKARKNVIKLSDPEVVYLLMYFGVTDFLMNDKAVCWGDAKSEIMAPIGVIEKALTDTLIEVGGETGKITFGEAIDVRSGLKQEEIVTNVILKNGNKTFIDEADFVVFADGTRSLGVKSIVRERDSLSSETMMFGIYLEKINHHHTFPNTDQEPIEITEFSFSGESDIGYFATASIAPSSAKKIREKQIKIQQLTDPIAIKKEKHDLNQWLIESAEKYMDSLGYKGKVVLANTFNVTISKGSESAVTLGESLMLMSGDAYATPDPASGSGAETTVKTSQQFFNSLNFWNKGVEKREITNFYNYSMTEIYDSFVEKSFLARATYTVQDTQNAARYLEIAKKNSKFLQTNSRHLLMILEKIEKNTLLTEEDLGILLRAKNEIESKEDESIKKLGEIINPIFSTKRVLN